MDIIGVWLIDTVFFSAGLWFVWLFVSHTLVSSCWFLSSL